MLEVYSCIFNRVGAEGCALCIMMIPSILILLARWCFVGFIFEAPAIVSSASGSCDSIDACAGVTDRHKWLYFIVAVLRYSFDASLAATIRGGVIKHLFWPPLKANNDLIIFGNAWWLTHEMAHRYRQANISHALWWRNRWNSIGQCIYSGIMTNTKHLRPAFRNDCWPYYLVLTCWSISDLM